MSSDCVRFNAKLTALLLTMVYITSAIGQVEDSTVLIKQFSGKILATHNGISLVPSFSLDDPAILFNLSLGGKRLTFEPDLRFALEGKPWSFLFWWRYKAIQDGRFTLRLGAHPAMNFRTIPAISNGKEKDVIESRRFFATEIAPNFAISKKMSIGLYYLWSIGFDDSNKYTHFLVFNTSFPAIKISDQINFGLVPAVYYLTLDELTGFYFTSSFRLTKSDFPFSLEGIINRIIRSDILPDRKFVWNISLVYSFSKQYQQFQ